jgi:hypothetical protein
MIHLVTLIVATVFLVALVINFWLVMRDPDAWWAAIRTRIAMNGRRLQARTHGHKAQIAKDAERIRQELFEEVRNLDGQS